MFVVLNVGSSLPGIGNLGENMSLRRSVLVCAAEGESLATYVHAKVGKSLHAQLGKCGAILRYKATGPADVSTFI
jgi:translation elongation factor EF-Ts